MNATQVEFERLDAGSSQCDRILAELKARTGEWVSMDRLYRLSGAHAVHSRVADLRKRGHNITHKNERTAAGMILSFYRLEP